MAVSEDKFITRVAKRTVVSDNAMSVLVPVLEKVLRWDSARIRRLFATYGLTLLEWDKMRTDRLIIHDSTEHMSLASAPQLNAYSAGSDCGQSSTPPFPSAMLSCPTFLATTTSL